jgi:YjbE family integral membrane protein
MDILSSQFLLALLSIIVIDLVLAGDNAIVIALAARSLPPEHRKRAIMWGALGAVAVRSVMTLAVVWLLKIPGLLAAGGLLLLWIAWKLVASEENGAEGVRPATTFVGAMRTIIVADAVMGVDNVLAVAGAAHGSYLLVVLGLLISVPIVVWGSTLLLRWTERFPVIVYVGTAVLAATAIKMILSEPLLAQWVPDQRAFVHLFYVVVVGAILVLGYRRNLTTRMRAALRSHPSMRRAQRRNAPSAENHPGDITMDKLLVPVDGSPNALAAVRQAAAESRSKGDTKIVLFNVQPHFSRHIARFFGRTDIASFHTERSRQAIAPAARLLDGMGISYVTAFETGPRADTIADYADRHRCTRIILGTARKNSLTRLVEASATARLLEIATVPVEVVIGQHASVWERWGIPAGVGAAIAALAIAIED